MKDQKQYLDHIDTSILGFSRYKYRKNPSVDFKKCNLRHNIVPLASDCRMGHLSKAKGVATLEWENILFLHQYYEILEVNCL